MNSGALIRASVAVISDNRFGLFGLAHKVGISAATANQGLRTPMLCNTEKSVIQVPLPLAGGFYAEIADTLVL